MTLELSYKLFEYTKIFVLKIHSIIYKNGFGRPLRYNDSSQDLPHKKNSCKENQAKSPNATVLSPDDRNSPYSESSPPSLETQEA